MKIILLKKGGTMKAFAKVGFVLFFGFSCFAQENQQTQVGCDCLHKAGTVTASDLSSEQSRQDTASINCANRLASIPGEEDVSLHIELLNNADTSNEPVYACFAIHYVYGFGSDREDAINNARQTCATLVSDDQQIEEAIVHPEECKDTR